MGGWVGTAGHVLFVSRLTFFPKSYLALEKYVAVSRKNRGIGGTGQESRKLINSAFSPNGNWVYILVQVCHMQPPSPAPKVENLNFKMKHYLIQFIAIVIYKNSGQKKWSRILRPYPYSNQSKVEKI